MSKNTELLHAMETGTRLFRAFESGADMIKAVVGLEQNQRELQSAIDAKRSELVGLEADVSAVKASMVTSRAQVSNMMDDAKTEAAKIRADAKARADTVGQQAEFNAKARLTEINDKIVQSRNDLEEVQVAVDHKIRELGELDRKVAELRASAAKILS